MNLGPTQILTPEELDKITPWFENAERFVIIEKYENNVISSAEIIKQLLEIADGIKKLDKEKRERGEKNALEYWDIVYYAQAQIYMLKMGLDRHYLVCALPGGRDMISVRTDLNTERANGYLKRAHRVINATFAPDRIAENSDFYICKFCNFKAECWK